MLTKIECEVRAITKIDDPEGRLSELEDDPVIRAKTAILAAKTAYQFKSERWLSLVSLALHAIERCPLMLQPHLRRDLQTFHMRRPLRPRPR